MTNDAMTDPLKALEQLEAKWRSQAAEYGSRPSAWMQVACADELAATVAGMRGRTCETCEFYSAGAEHLRCSHPDSPVDEFYPLPPTFGCTLHQPTPPEPVKGDEK